MRERIQALLFFLIPFLGTLPGILRVYERLAQGAERTWQVGGFFINYEAGFTRRGLIGSLFLELSRWIEPIDLLDAITFSMLIALAWVCWRVAWNCRQAQLLDAYLVAFCPALYSIFLLWDPAGGWRQDMFSILFILLSVKTFQSKRTGAWKVQLFWGIGLLPCLALTHEASLLFCLAPYLLILGLQLEAHFMRRTILAMLLFASLPGIAALGFVLANGSATAEQLLSMCEAWRPVKDSITCAPLPDVLQAIHESDDWIKRAADAWEHSRRPAQAGYLFAYLFLLAWLPIARISAARGDSQNQLDTQIAAFVLALIAVIPTIPLYFVGIDFGRWLTVSVTIFILTSTDSSLMSRLIEKLHARMGEARGFPQNESLLSRVPSFVLALIFPLYMVSHCCVQLWDLKPIWERFG